MDQVPGSHRVFGEYADRNVALMERGIAGGYTRPCESMLSNFTIPETDAETVHQPGLAEMKRIRGEMDAIIEGVGDGFLPLVVPEEKIQRWNDLWR